jgi:hypothetical protein
MKDGRAQLRIPYHVRLFSDHNQRVTSVTDQLPHLK